MDKSDANMSDEFAKLVGENEESEESEEELWKVKVCILKYYYHVLFPNCQIDSEVCERPLAMDKGNFPTSKQIQFCSLLLNHPNPQLSWTLCRKISQFSLVHK